MSTKTITRIIIGATIFVLVIIIFYVQSNLQQNVDREIVVEPEQVEATEPKKSKDSMTTDRLQEIEDSIAKLERNEVDQDLAIKDLSEKNEATVAASSTASDHKILTTTNAKGSSFTTTSTSYSPMAMFVNINCPVQCTLWIEFYTSSKNNSANNVNTYGVFLNGQDQSTYSQATIPVANGSVSIALNTSLSVAAGTHTVEIKTKTSGGTLQSDISSLQVMGIER